MDTGRKSSSQHTILIVRLRDNLSCNTIGNHRIFDMFVTLALADECGFLQRFQLLLMINEQNGHETGVPWNDFSFGWEYGTNVFVDKRGAKEHVDV